MSTCECGQDHEGLVLPSELPLASHLVYLGGAFAGASFMLRFFQEQLERLGLSDIYDEVVENYSPVEYVITMEGTDVQEFCDAAYMTYRRVGEELVFQDMIEHFEDDENDNAV